MGKSRDRELGQMIVQDRVRLMSTLVPIELAVMPGGRLEIGEGTFINYGTSIGVSQSVKIGPNCAIGTYVMIMDNNFHRLEPDRRNEVPDSAAVTLEENCLVGRKSDYPAGRDHWRRQCGWRGQRGYARYPANTLAAGNPAKVIRSL